MLAISGGRLLALSTPWGKRGWFYTEWSMGEYWQQTRVTAAQCPRISPLFLEEERRTLPPAWYDAEYGCQFTETEYQVFRDVDIDAALTDTVQPLYARFPWDI